MLHNRKKKVFHLGYSTKDEQWDPENSVPNSKHPDHKIIKSRIRNDLLYIKTIIADFENRHQPFTLEEVEKLYRDKTLIKVLKNTVIY